MFQLLKKACKQAQHMITATKTVDEIKSTPKIDLKVGDKVIVKIGSKSVSGDGLASFLSDKKEARTIMSINGGNATIGKDGIVTATTSMDNLVKV